MPTLVRPCVPGKGRGRGTAQGYPGPLSTALAMTEAAYVEALVDFEISDVEGGYILECGSRGTRVTTETHGTKL